MDKISNPQTELEQRLQALRDLWWPPECEKAKKHFLFKPVVLPYADLMAEITPQRSGEHLINLLRILKKNPDGLQASQALGQLALITTLTPYEEGDYASTGTRRFEKIIRFATVGCVKAGWMVKQKGIWMITESGEEALKSYTQPEQFYGEMLKRYKAWRKNRPTPITEDATDKDELEDEAATVTREQAQEQAWGEISSYLEKMPPYDFQDMVADLIEATGYHITHIAPPGRDGGIDIIAHPDALGVQSPCLKVQVKRLTTSKVDTDAVKSFASSLGDDAGLFVCLSGFTRAAEEYARLHSRVRMNLIDKQRLVDLWTDHYHKLSDTARQRLPLTPIYFLILSE